MNTLLLCLEIFGARLIDVSLGTIRTVIVVKGKNFLGSILGFIEVTVWFPSTSIITILILMTISSYVFIISNNILIVIFYSLGFAVGTYIGGKLSKKLIKSKLEVQVITSCDVKVITANIRNSGYAVSILKLESSGDEDKHMLFLEVDSDKFENLKANYS